MRPFVAQLPPALRTTLLACLVVVAVAGATPSAQAPLPGVVTGLTVTVAGDRATAAWTAGPDVLYYRLEWASATPGSPIGSTTTTQTALTGVVPPGQYLIRVGGVSLAGPGPMSAPVAFTVAGGPGAGPPPAPRDLLATQEGGRLVLRWNASVADPVATTHRIELGTAPGASDLGVYDTGSPQRTVGAPVPAGITYWARVRAGNAAGYGPASSDVSITLLPTTHCQAPPAAPLLPDVALANTGAGRTATLTFAMPFISEAPTAYVIELGTASGRSDIATIEVPVVPSVTGPVVPGRVYFVRVRARNACGLSGASAESSFWVF
jgi:hypothetical protein